MTGMHRSPYHGFSVEFAQHRQYAPGDDIRHLDWKVYGRTDKLYLKQYQQETNLDLIILIDVSGSMAYGSISPGGRTWRKYDHAASLAAALAFLAMQQRDRVGLIFFADTVQSVTRVSSAKGHWQSVIEGLSSQFISSGSGQTTLPPTIGRSTDLARLFQQVLAKISQRSLIVLISDLFDDPASLERGLAKTRHWQHDLMIFQVLDPAEREFPFRSPTEFLDLEGHQRVRVDPAALRRGYLQALGAHLQRVEQIARQIGFDHLILDSSMTLGPPLSRFLARRASTMNRMRTL